MAIPSKDDLAQWAYIQSIYNSINKERKRLSTGADLAIPDYVDDNFLPKQISDIKDEITKFNNNTYVKNNSAAQTAINSIAIPVKDDYIYPPTLETTMDVISRVCTYDGSYRGGYRGGYDGSYDGGYCGSNRGTQTDCYTSPPVTTRAAIRTGVCTLQKSVNRSINRDSNRGAYDGVCSHFGSRRDLKPTR